MRIHRRTPGVTVTLRPATDEDLFRMELKHPDDGLLPTFSARESWLMTVGSRQDPVGFVEYFINNGVLTITGHWVDPDHRGNGYGAIMLDLVEATEKPNVMRIVTIPATDSFYQKLGFRQDPNLRILSRASDPQS